MKNRITALAPTAIFANLFRFGRPFNYRKKKSRYLISPPRSASPRSPQFLRQSIPFSQREFLFPGPHGRSFSAGDGLTQEISLRRWRGTFRTQVTEGGFRERKGRERGGGTKRIPSSFIVRSVTTLWSALLRSVLSLSSSPFSLAGVIDVIVEGQKGREEKQFDPDTKIDVQG